jgi:Ala-tRNA(Pro) deacylase
MYKKQEVYALLNERGIEYEAIEHEAVYNMEEADALELPHREAGTKNLFIRDDKKRNYYVVSIPEHDRLDLKGLREKLGSRPLKFAQDNELMDLMGLIPGQVTPFGTLNDTEHKVKVLISDYFKGGLMDAHPNDNTATIILKADDVVEVLKNFGVDISYIKL